MRYSFLTILFCLACSREQSLPELPDFGPVKVKTATATSKPIHDELIVTGHVLHGFDVFANQSGKVEVVNFSNGDFVQAGDTLAVILNGEIAHRLTRAEASYQRMLLHHESESLGYPSDDSIQQMLAHRTGLTLAEADRALMNYVWSERFIIARRAGVLTRWSMYAGKYLSKGASVGRIVPATRGEVSAYFLEQEWQLLQIGTEALIKLADGRRVSGELVEKNPQVDELGRFSTSWRMMNRRFVPEGMTAEIVPALNAPEAVVIPVGAVGAVAGKPVVFTAEDDSARWNSVELRWYSEDSVEVVEGITPGDRVILSYHIAIHDGTPIEISDGVFPHGN